MGSGVSNIAYVGATNVISSVGFTTEECFKALERYVSGIVPVDDSLLYEHPFLAAQVDWQRLSAMAKAAGLDGYTGTERMMILSIKDVLEQSGISLASKDAAVIFSSTKGKLDITTEDEGRRASPLLVHIHPLKDDKFVAIQTLLPGIFLPDGMKVEAKGKSKYAISESTVDYAVITRYLDGFANKKTLKAPKHG